jgi:hypothetical protein
MTTNNSEIHMERLDVKHELPAGQDGTGEGQEAEQGIAAAEA